MSELREAFMSRDSARSHRSHQPRVALLPERLHQLQVITFAKFYGGAERSTTESVAGHAPGRQRVTFYMKELRPLGYKLHAEIVSYPGGMPGEAALILKW
jgi:hypothetical protein